MTKKENLLENLKNNTFCRLSASKHHGVGVFAIRDIPAGTRVFKMSNNLLDPEELIALSEDDLKELHPNVAKYIKDVFVETNNAYYLPEKGMNSIGVGFLINHNLNSNMSNNFNIVSENGYAVATSSRDIKEGEELTEDYYSFTNKDAVERQFSFLRI